MHDHDHDASEREAMWLWNDDYALAKSDALSECAEYLERTYGENGVCSTHTHQRTLHTLLDVIREHSSDMQDIATKPDALEDSALRVVARIYGDDDDASDYTPASELDDTTRARARRDDASAPASDEYQLSVYCKHVGAFTWWSFVFTCGEQHVVDANFDVCATRERDATRIALEWAHARITACCELDHSHSAYYSHQLRVLRAITRHASQFGFTGESVVMMG